jgi:hypothetical protein
MKTLIVIFTALLLSLLYAGGTWAQTGESRTGEYTVAEPHNEGGFFVEPGITHESSSSRINFREHNTDGSVTGFGISARVGAHFWDALIGGIDARYSRPDYKDSTLNLSSSADQYNAGPFIGVQTPYAGIRIWGVYVPFAEVNPGESNGVKVKYTNGAGYRLGAGVRISTVSLNFEYQNIDYSNISIQNSDRVAANFDVGGGRLINEAYLLGLSFPIAF